MVKIRIFALFLAAQLSLFSLDRAVAMDTSVEPSKVSEPETQTVDSFSKIQPPVHPSFSAHYRLHHQPSTTVLDEARVLYSDAGMRVEQFIDQSANVFIANHAEGKFWFVDRQRQLFHSIPVTVTQPETQSSGHPDIQPMAGFIQLSPCAGLEGRSTGTELLKGRVVQRWTCMKWGEVVEEQWYAPTPGVVLRSRTNDGYVSELTDFRDRDSSTLNFQPPSHYRQVSIEELMNPAVPIGSYIE